MDWTVLFNTKLHSDLDKLWLRSLHIWSLFGKAENFYSLKWATLNSPNLTSALPSLQGLIFRLVGGSPHRKPYYFPSSFLQSRFERHTTIPIELVEVLQLFWVGVSGARYQRIGGLLQSYIYFSLCFQIAWAILGHDEDRNMSDCCMSSHSTFSLHDSHIWDLHYRFLNLPSNSARQQACGLDQYHQETTLSQLFDWLETNCAKARRHIYLLHL